MNEQHSSALALIKELHSLGATEVVVGDVQARWPERAFMPVPAELPPDKSEMEIELEALRMFKAQMEAGGLY